MVKKTFIIALLAVLAAALLAACSQKASRQGKAANPSDVLAVVNGSDITVDEFKQEAASLPPGAVQALQSSDKNREKFLDNLIDKELIVQKAKAAGMDKDPEVAKRMQAIEKSLLLSLYVKKEVLDKASVTDKDAQDYFNGHKADLGSVRISHILVATQPEAQAALDKLKAGEDFAKLARQVSLDTKTKNNGGDLGWVKWQQFGSSGLKDAAFKLKPGEVSDIVQSQFGYHIMKVTDKKPAADADFKAMQDDLKAMLIDKKKEDLFDAIVKSMKDSAKISKSPENLKAVKFDDASVMQGMPAPGAKAE